MRILLVEDEEKVSHFVVHGLKAEGYALDAVDDAHEQKLIRTLRDVGYVLGPAAAA